MSVYLFPGLTPFISRRYPFSLWFVSLCLILPAVSQLYSCESRDSGFRFFGLQVKILWRLQAHPGLSPAQPEHIHLYFAFQPVRFGWSCPPGRRRRRRLRFDFGRWRANFEFNFWLVFFRLIFAGDSLEVRYFTFCLVSIGNRPMISPLWENSADTKINKIILYKINPEIQSE